MVYWFIGPQILHTIYDIFLCYLDNFLNVVIDKSLFNRAQLCISEVALDVEYLPKQSQSNLVIKWEVFIISSKR